MHSLTVAQAAVASVLSALIIYGTRLLPFVAFGKKEPPLVVRFIERYSASLIIAVLIVYCFKDVDFTSISLTAPYLIAAASVVILHLLFDNSLISIFGGTILFMVLSRLM